MKQCLNCYAIGCKDRAKPPERTTNYEVINTSVSHMAKFLSSVITDCSVCPAKVGCSQDKSSCEMKLRRWLHALAPKELIDKLRVVI